jgi:alkanesulfonate monooxygenase SsuD/methylene tetrahydromethanopterin reductase-like flavin-dependent oxidoreductase (luciferase family)
VWGTPDLLAQKNQVLDRHCEDLGRDPSAIGRSAQALLFMSDDEAWLSQRRAADVGRPALVGTPSELVDVIGAYADAGVDELIFSDFNIGRLDRKLDTFDRFIAEVAAPFRQPAR